MAGDWIKIETALPTKIEILQLTELLDCSRAEALGYCVVFWCWCDANMSPECRHVAATKKTLDDVIGATGFAQAMVDVGWLHETLVDDRPALEVPNFDQHLSKSAKTRARKTKNKQSERSGDGKLVAEMSPRDGDKTETREEKRRDSNTRAPNNTEGVNLNSNGNANGITERGDIVVPSSLTKRAVSAVWSWIDYTNRPDTEAREVWPDSPQAEALFALAARWKLSDDDIEQHVETAIAGNWLKLNTPRQGEYRSGATTEEHAGRF